MKQNDYIIIDGTKYPKRTLNVKIDDRVMQIIVATQSLRDKLDIENDDSHMALDDTIYYYVDDDEIYRPAKQICEDCLDDEHEFISEVGIFYAARLIDISLTTRVVSDANATELELSRLAKPKYLEKLENDEILDNIGEIINDTEVPFGELDEDLN